MFKEVIQTIMAGVLLLFGGRVEDPFFGDYTDSEDEKFDDPK